jgi:Ca-activated chloride channel family protein
MTFLSGYRMLLMLAVVALIAAYLWRQRHRRQYAVRFTNLALLDVVAPRRPGWRRHVSAGAFLLALTTLVVAFARPAVDDKVPVDATTIIVAIDVSGSMAATDVAPSRLAAAKTAANQFVKNLPARFDVGLVSFAQTARTVIAPTNDHPAVATAIDELQLGGGTAIGEAIYASLDALAATPVADAIKGSPARIVLMSDGATNSGRPNDAAAAAAATAHVPVTTIAYGTDSGQVTIGLRTIDVPADKDALKAIADTTGGKFFQAASANQLKDVYNTIRSAVSHRLVHRDISGWFLGAGLLLLAAAAAASLAWSPLLP